VRLCEGEEDDVLLATKRGKAIRFRATDIRVFAGRNSTGVRGVKLGKGDEVISMSILKHVDITAEERDAYMKAASQIVGSNDEDYEYPETDMELSEDRFNELLEKEQLLLTVSEGGFGKRTSSYEYRVTGRGGQGIVNMALTKKNGNAVAATFPVTDDHQIMLVTDKGKLIRTHVNTIRTTGRSAQGVTIFKVGSDERVVSVAWLVEDQDEEAELEGVEGEAIEAEADAESANSAPDAKDSGEPEESDQQDDGDEQ